MSASLAWQTADWLRLLRTPVQLSDSDAPAALAAPELERIVPLFGTSAAVRGDAPPPPTNLRLTLLGSFVHEDPQRSSAIIQREGGKPQRYVLGNELDSGIRLHAVYPDRVELERNGRLETLPFPARSNSRGDIGYSVAPPVMDPVDQLDELEEENAELLRERMKELYQQMESAGTLPDDSPLEPPMESE
jgi:general secretion pathway protein C